MASYNVLADGYIKGEYYPHVDVAALDPKWRLPAVAVRAAGLGADILCLQEVERPVLAMITSHLPDHFQDYGPKPGRRDGVATFARAPMRDRRLLSYPDDTARVALMAVIEHEGRRLGVANTHLKLDATLGLTQAAALAEAIAAFEPACDGWVVCGDLNAIPASPVLDRLRMAGLRDSHEGREEHTSNFAVGLKRIDYVLVSSSLSVTPIALPALARDTVLPSKEEPSDHVPVQCLVDWA